MKKHKDHTHQSMSLNSKQYRHTNLSSTVLNLFEVLAVSWNFGTKIAHLAEASTTYSWRLSQNLRPLSFRVMQIVSASFAAGNLDPE
jgi:DNA polymerase III psi subunit